MKKTKIIIILMIIVFSPIFSHCSYSTTLLEHNITGLTIIGYQNDFQFSAQALSGGGIYILAVTQSFGYPHIGYYDGALWITMIDYNGSIIWSKIYPIDVTTDDPFGVPTYLYWSTILQDDSIVVAASSLSENTAYIGRIYPNGTVACFLNITPTTTYSGYYLLGVASGDDGNIIVSGNYYNYTDSRGHLLYLKISANGSLMWATDIPMNAVYYAYATTVHGNKVVGTAYSYGLHSPPIVIILDYNTGNIINASYIGNEGEGYFSIQAVDNAIYIGGMTNELGGRDAMIAKLTWNLTVDKGIVLNNTLPGNEWFIELRIYNETLYTAGYVSRGSYGGSLVASLNMNLTPYWIITYDYNNNDTYASNVIPNGDGYVLTVGSLVYGSNYDIYLLQMKNGSLLYPCKKMNIERWDNVENILLTSNESMLTSYTASLNIVSLDVYGQNIRSYIIRPLCARIVGGILLINNTFTAILLITMFGSLIVLTGIALSKNKI